MWTVLVFSFSKFQTNFHFKIKYFGGNIVLMVFCYDTIRTKGLLFIMTRLSELRKILPISWFCLQIRHFCILKWISKLSRIFFFGFWKFRRNYIVKKIHQKLNQDGSDSKVIFFIRDNSSLLSKLRMSNSYRKRLNIFSKVGRNLILWSGPRIP